MQHIIVYAITAGSLFLLLLAILSTTRKVNIFANYWLSFFLFSFACTILDRVFFDTDVYDQYPLLAGWMEVSRFAMSPALYFSVLYFTIPDRKVKSTDYLHFIPFFLFFIFILTLVLGINDSAMFLWYHQLPDNIRQVIAISVFSSFKIQMIVYWTLSYLQLIRHTRNARVFASSLEPISLAWLRYFLLGLAVAVFLSLNEVLQGMPIIIPLTHFGYLILTFYLAYFSLRQQEIYPYRPKDVLEIRDLIEPDAKGVRTQRFTAEELVLVKQNLLHVMETQKVHLDPNLGLPQLAARVRLSTHDLSYVINEGFGENFFQFVNRYRIEEAKTLLISAQHRHLNILGIAYESGFRSKSTFNTTFKKLTGKSPSEFMRSVPSVNKKVA